MIKVVYQYSVDETTLLFTDKPIPYIIFKEISIDSKLYKSIEVYDLERAVAIEGTGDFVGKEVKLV